MRSVTTLVFVALVGNSLLSSQASPAGGECAAQGPPLVRITAQRLSAAPPSYAFLVTNLGTVGITGIVVGRHERTMPIRSIAPNVPARMESPPGWEGRHVPVEETPFLVYLWENRDPSKHIAPQQSAAGFRITLPDARNDPAQVTFARVPFKAALADGSCRWGLVGLDPLPQ
jgi:hypothetical protein